MGYLVRQDAPVAWRGMMVVKALQQLLHEVDWGGLDMLVLDLPPGTGDTQLTIAQQVELDGITMKMIHASIVHVLTRLILQFRCYHRFYSPGRCSEGHPQGYLHVSKDERQRMTSSTSASSVSKNPSFLTATRSSA